MKYREMTEKKYIHRMFKSKEFSPRTYQRKRRDLEKWVTKEKEEIKQSKKHITETWVQTAKIISEAQKDSLKYKQILLKHPTLYNSESNSIISSILDSSRSIDEGQEAGRNRNTFFNIEKYWKRDKSLDDLDHVLKTEEIRSSLENTEKFKYQTDCEHNEAILIQDNNLPEELPIDQPELDFPRQYEPNEENKELVITQNTNNTVIEINNIKEEVPVIGSILIDIKRKDDQEIVIVKPDKNIDSIGETNEIVNNIYNGLINELIGSLYPMRNIEGVKVSKESEIPNFRDSSSLELFDDKHRRGIQLDTEYIENFLAKIFDLMISKYKNNFIKEVNNAISRPIAELLESIEKEKNLRIMQQLPHDLQPIIPISIFLDIEKEKKYDTCDSSPNTIKTLGEYEQIHDKVIFDSVNEALNLIRPYGLNGEPFPWSAQQRILFKSINDPNIITRNIKNMILDWVSFEVGVLPHSDFITDGKFDEDYFADIREKRLLNMLAQEVYYHLK